MVCIRVTWLIEFIRKKTLKVIVKRRRMWLILDEQLLFLIAWSPISLIINCFKLLMEQKKSPFLWELREDLDISGLSFSYLSLLATSKRFIEFFFYHLITKKWRVDTSFHFKNTKFTLKLSYIYLVNTSLIKTCFFYLYFEKINKCKLIKSLATNMKEQNLMTPLSALWSRLKYWSPLFL